MKVISGDNPVTVSNVAKQAGIEHADRYVDASELETEEELREAVLKNTVFGRVTPNQKRKFVRILKDAGHTVAMTGDGVNDVLALKDADCSIAMASGSEAAAPGVPARAAGVGFLLYATGRAGREKGSPTISSARQACFS